jgi:hypothetical protein
MRAAVLLLCALSLTAAEDKASVERDAAAAAGDTKEDLSPDASSRSKQSATCFLQRAHVPISFEGICYWSRGT